MGGAIEWPALPIISEMFGVIDFDMFLRELCAIRDFQLRQREHA